MVLKTVAVWGDEKLPAGFEMLGVLFLDPKKHLYFVVGAPSVWVRSASQSDLARALTETIGRELRSAIDRGKSIRRLSN